MTSDRIIRAIIIKGECVGGPACRPCPPSYPENETQELPNQDANAVIEVWRILCYGENSAVDQPSPDRLGTQLDPTMPNLSL